jgi:hypothetical protein
MHGYAAAILEHLLKNVKLFNLNTVIKYSQAVLEWAIHMVGQDACIAAG